MKISDDLFPGIEDLPYAKNCHHLYMSGIFYNSTYMIQSNGFSSVTSERCGFTGIFLFGSSL